jgi:acyl-CoA reductase-like NAD-dependent aldehyde dehydrogenase
MQISQTVEPVTGSIISSVTNLDRQDFIKAIEAASVAQKSYYKSTTAAHRGELLRKWYDLIIANKEDCRFIFISQLYYVFTDTRQWQRYSASRMGRHMLRPKERWSTPRVLYHGSQKKQLEHTATPFRPKCRIPQP